MLTKTILLDETARFHARPASILVGCAQQFESMICISTENYIADAKQILSVMRLAVSATGRVEIVTEGSDELAAMSAIEHTLQEMEWR